jgi:ABC-type Fe3+-hydroxamate transport system substrate-binding protein
MLSLTDHVNNIIHLRNYPKRVISLVPSQTELLYDLGLDDEVIGITKFCIHPDNWFRTKTRVGGTKTADIQKITSLKPDLIIANKEENVKDQIEELQKVAPVYVSDIVTLEDALQMIKDVGKLTGKQQKAEEISVTIKTRFEELETFNEQGRTLNAQKSSLNLSTSQPSYLSTNQQLNLSTNKHTPLRTAYLIWKDPYMAVGGDTFINEMLKRCGLENIFESEQRYPQVEINQLSSVNCQLLILSSEPYPFKQKHIDELQQRLPQTKIILVDGEMFSWHGSRLLYAPDYFGRMIALNHLF